MTDQSSQWPGWDPTTQATPQPAQDPAQDPTQQQAQQAQQQAWYGAQDATQYRTQDPTQQQAQQPTQYPAQGQAAQGRYYPPTGVAPAMRAGSADRERAVDVLRAGFAEGRLTQDEYNDRMNRAYEARTYGELHALVADLPIGPVPAVLPPTWHPAPVARTNSLATASMVLGLAEFATMGLTALPAVICGHIARGQMRQTAEQGTGMAITGLVLGYLGIFFWVALLAGLTLALGHSGGGSPAFPQPGQ